VGELQPVPVPVSREPVDDSERLAAVARLHDLVGTGGLSLERFSASLEQVLAANDQADLETAMAALPSLVRLTPASRRLSQPLKLDAGIGKLRLGAGWQLAGETEVTASTGKVWLDLTGATWDSRSIDLRLRVVTGKIEVIVPKGVAVQILSATNRVTLDNLVPPVPGAPVLRVVASTAAGGGRIRFTHELQQRARSHWWQRGKASGPAV
jgi:Domain of unknown function (DUF1707)